MTFLINQNYNYVYYSQKRKPETSNLRTNNTMNALKIIFTAQNIKIQIYVQFNKINFQKDYKNMHFKD